MEGGVFLCRHTTTNPSLARIVRRRGVFLCQVSTHHNPSLARIVRWRGSHCQHTLSTPLSLETWDGGGCFFCRHTTTYPSLTWIARQRGSRCRHTTTYPSLTWIARQRGSPCQHTLSTPPSLETRDGGVVSSVDTPPPTPPSLKLRDGGVFFVNKPLPRSKLGIAAGTRNPWVNVTGCSGVRVRVAKFVPSENPYPCHGLTGFDWS